MRVISRTIGLLECLSIYGSLSAAAFVTDCFRPLPQHKYEQHWCSVSSSKILHSTGSFRHKSKHISKILANYRSRSKNPCACFGWLEDFFEPQKTAKTKNLRQNQYPEQYPATYELNDAIVKEDDLIYEAKIVRPLLKNTQLESRPLELAYDANRDGWNPSGFHAAVDGRGATVIIAVGVDGTIYGGYNPKGYASLGGARPSVAAFLFYDVTDMDKKNTKERDTTPLRFQKLRKVGGGGLACARDDPGFAISFGPDALVIGLQPGREKIAQSKLGPYFERGPHDLPSLFWKTDGATELKELKVLVGCYMNGEEIPYSGGVLDMTSG